MWQSAEPSAAMTTSGQVEYVEDATSRHEIEKGGNNGDTENANARNFQGCPSSPTGSS
jgi:hypothetical protein